MNIEILRTLYTYHYQRLREIWDSILTLDEARFFEEFSYSAGSLRNHMVHLIDDDLSWFSLLQGKERPTPLRPDSFTALAEVQALYDRMEADHLHIVFSLEDPDLEQEFIWRPDGFANPQYVKAWQVWIHVVNHGTDHRAQLLQILTHMGAPTFNQDFMGYLVQSGITSTSSQSTM